MTDNVIDHLNMERLGDMVPTWRQAFIAMELLDGFAIAAADGDANVMAEQLARHPISDPANLTAVYQVICDQ